MLEVFSPPVTIIGKCGRLFQRRFYEEINKGGALQKKLMKH
jgi:hypothetical protein